MVYSNEPCQQYSAYKQIGLTDDAVALLVSVSPAHHLSTPFWTQGNVSLSGKLTAAFFPTLSLSSIPPINSLSLFPPPLFPKTLFRASWKVISHYFPRCISSYTSSTTCQLSAAAPEIMNYASLTTGQAQPCCCLLLFLYVEMFFPQGLSFTI